MIIPLGDKILVEPFVEEEVTKAASGILIKADTSEKKIFLYKVLNVGEKVSIPLNKNDLIYSYRYALMAIADGLEEKYIIKESDVVARYVKG